MNCMNVAVLQVPNGRRQVYFRKCRDNFNTKVDGQPVRTVQKRVTGITSVLTTLQATDSPGNVQANDGRDSTKKVSANGVIQSFQTIRDQTATIVLKTVI